jgi:2,4-dienoyl-CoA reductase-like NADH-dependent reductase (Old Yellow Enzyme family)/thioredoxin reductase
LRVAFFNPLFYTPEGGFLTALLITHFQDRRKASMTAFGFLFQPIRIGNMTVKNRLLMSAMSINFGVDEQGRVTDQLIGYMAARARGGVGMMLVGGGGIDPGGAELPHLPALWDDGCIEGLARMADAIRPFNCRLGMQLMHGGRQSYHEHKVAPSAIAAPAVVKGVPRALTLEEIVMLEAAFGDAARRCRQAGFDFIEIHAAHGYLINQFMAPNANRRTDQYGGSFENRIRFLMELLDDIQAKCGSDFPVGVRINGEDYIDNGWTLAEALRLAPLLEARGVAYLHVSAGVYGSKQLTIPSMYVEQGCFIHLAEAVKQTVRIPVVAVGRIKHPQMAERIIEEEKADMVALGRSLLSDPQWPIKADAGAVQQIRPCIGCCLGCIHAVLQLEPGGCVVNPDVGREYQLDEDYGSAVPPKNILVVGAGPAGLAAARMAALRGHRVSVCDRQAEPGGALRLAALPPGRADLSDIVTFLKNELQRLGIEVRYHTHLDETLLNDIAPHEVVVATGSLPEMPMLKGLFRTAMQLCTITEVLEGQIESGRKVIVLGGNQAGLVLADHLAEQGKQVVVLHRKHHFAEEMSSNDRYYLRERLKHAAVPLYKDVHVENVLSDGVCFHSAGQTHTLQGFDTIVLADTFVSLREEANLIKKLGLPVHFIGDARQPRHLMYAIAEGEEIGRAL